MEYTVDKIIQSDDTAWGSKLVSGGGQNISSDVMDPTRWVVWWIREGTEDFFFFFFWYTCDFEYERMAFFER